jgi:hypothetical protein
VTCQDWSDQHYARAPQNIPYEQGNPVTRNAVWLLKRFQLAGHLTQWTA